MKRVLYISSSGTRGQTQAKKGVKSNAFSITNRTKNKVAGSEKVGKVMKPKDKDLNMKYDISSSLSMNTITKKLHKTLGIIDDPSQNSLYNWNMSLNYYNRFKLPTTNDMLQKGFAHVFFVRPDCNILSNGKATSSVMNNQFFAMQAKRSPGLLKELVLNNGKKHDFMLSLSNKVASFSLADEYINSDTYGKGYTGYKIAYGKNNIESKTAGQLSITFTDDRNGRVYKYLKFDGKKCLNFNDNGTCTDEKDTSIYAMVENLNVGKMVDGSLDQNVDNEIERYCYDNDTLICHYYGGLYQWAEMMQLPSACNNMDCSDRYDPTNHQGICPKGWRLLTYEDFYIILNSNGNTHGIEGLRSSFGCGGYNGTGFSLVCGGENWGYAYDNFDEGVYWFYPEETDSNLQKASGSFTGLSMTTVRKGSYKKTHGFSVRCVKAE